MNVESTVNHPDPIGTRIAEKPGVPVTLADGNVWYLASPSVLIVPKVIVRENLSRIGLKEEGIELDARVGYPLRISRPLDELAQSIDPKTGSAPHAKIFAAAAALLMGCHTLTVSEAVGLLECDGPGLVDLIHAMSRAARGDDDQGVLELVDDQGVDELVDDQGVDEMVVDQFLEQRS